MTHQQASATAVPLLDASLFDIVGPIHVNYTTSSITGTPRFRTRSSISTSRTRRSHAPKPRWVSWSPSPWRPLSTPSPVPSL